MKFALKVNFRTERLQPISVHSTSTVSPRPLAKNVQLAIIESRPRAFQRAIDEPCMLPRSAPKGGTNRDFAVFLPVKFNFCRKKSAAKFFV